MSKFKNGDRVRTVRQNLPLYDLGETGRVICWRKVGDMYLVRFDDKDGILRESWLCDGSIELLKAKHPVIVITTDGVTTTATKRLGKKVLGTAYSKCAPADTFDYDTSAGLALARLCGFKIQIHEEEEKPVPKEKPWPKKLVCVEANAYPDELCVGQVYPTEQYEWTKDFGFLRVKDGTSWGIRRHSDTEFRINCYPDYALFVPLIED